MRQLPRVRRRRAAATLVALLAVVAVGCGQATDPVAEPVADEPVAPGEDLPPVSTLPPEAVPEESEEPFRVVEGAFAFSRIVTSLDPLLISTVNITAPTAAVIATNGAAAANPPVADGETVRISYQVYSWKSDEYYDGSPAGTLLDLTVGSSGLPAILDRSLHWAVPGDRLLVVLPAGTADLPAYLPHDTAYYAVIDVFPLDPAV